jgi:hypothetical protein
MNWKAIIWLFLFFPIGVYILLKEKKTNEETSNTSSIPNNAPAKAKKEKKPTSSNKPKQPSKSDRKLKQLFDRYEELATQTEKYRKILRFRNDAGMFSEGCWKTHYGKIDLESSPKYGFLGEILKTDPLVKNAAKGDKFCSPFGWTTDFEITFDKLKESLEFDGYGEPTYTGFFSPISLETLVTKHHKELEELLASESQAKYEYIVRLVGSHDFQRIDSSSFERIIRRFPDMDSFMKASISKISEIEGISRATATTIKENVEDIYYS